MLGRKSPPNPKGPLTGCWKASLILSVLQNYPKHRRPGWNNGSIAYHGDEGYLFEGSTVGLPFGPPCDKGDIIGCGIIFPRDFISSCNRYWRNPFSERGPAFGSSERVNLRLGWDLTPFVRSVNTSHFSGAAEIVRARNAAKNWTTIVKMPATTATWMEVWREDICFRACCTIGTLCYPAIIGSPSPSSPTLKANWRRIAKAGRRGNS